MWGEVRFREVRQLGAGERKHLSVDVVVYWMIWIRHYKPDGALVEQVIPGPVDQHLQAVSKADQLHDMHTQL